jgi:RHH-type proline utilization regulon transcriptional repressor/proline dehydrogenase/delta 1-pyrroline-5-carboxylate dehydrogenase
VEDFGRELSAFAERRYRARPVVDGAELPGVAVTALAGPAGNPAAGEVEFANVRQVEDAVGGALAAWPAWEAAGVGARVAVLRRAADLLEAARAEFVALLVREAGRIISDALDEVREAVDFLRYYAAEAETLMGSPRVMSGPTGERNELRLRARGVFACISPWNFPLAITTGQLAAALVTGNAVVSKPAEQASLVAARLVALLRQAGVPSGVLQFLPGDGATIGAALVADPRLAGVAFTGSTTVARTIARVLAGQAGPGAVLVAETGGVNVLVADSTALPEQLTRDVVRSAFNSAGQRCSALRVLAVQEEIAPRVIELLAGRMATLRIGVPWELATDVGPVIDAEALQRLEIHREGLRREGRILYECRPPEFAARGQFFPPVLCEIDVISIIKEEIFGPILHLCRFPGSAWPALLAEINASGYGLTSGLHSRIGRRAREFADRVLAGNVYVNRNMVGAVVGVQPFGGRGLSGGGPKAGGPNYLVRFTTEQAVSINTAAIGGNAQLLGLRGGE